MRWCVVSGTQSFGEHSVSLFSLVLVTGGSKISGGSLRDTWQQSYIRSPQHSHCRPSLALGQVSDGALALASLLRFCLRLVHPHCACVVQCIKTPTAAYSLSHPPARSPACLFRPTCLRICLPVCLAASRPSHPHRDRPFPSPTPAAASSTGFLR